MKEKRLYWQNVLLVATARAGEADRDEERDYWRRVGENAEAVLARLDKGNKGAA
jgi:hypothetical protein